jgi:hypothetical protein
MFISKVLSYLGGWNTLQNEYTEEYQQLLDIIDRTKSTFKTIRREEVRKEKYSPPIISHSPNEILRKEFIKLGWSPDCKIRLLAPTEKRYSTMDVTKNGVGIEYGFGKFAFIESHIFVKIPLFIRANKIKIGIVLTYSEELAKRIDGHISSFETVADRIAGLSPILKYPFVMIGLSDNQREPVYQELTSELDQFLLKRIGNSLQDMVTQNEGESYDFKSQLPTNKKIAQEVCAFANNSGGGLILVGIDKYGEAVGIPKTDVDETILHLSNVSRDSCLPPPTIRPHIFELPSSASRCIVIFDINELERKPCMLAENKVIYIRDGSSAIPAGPEHVRKILIGNIN